MWRRRVPGPIENYPMASQSVRLDTSFQPVSLNVLFVDWEPSKVGFLGLNYECYILTQIAGI